MCLTEPSQSSGGGVFWEPGIVKTHSELRRKYRWGSESERGVGSRRRRGCSRTAFGPRTSPPPLQFPPQIPCNSRPSCRPFGGLAASHVCVLGVRGCKSLFSTSCPPAQTAGSAAMKPSQIGLLLTHELRGTEPGKS